MNKIKSILLSGMFLLCLIACGESYDQVIEIESLGNQMKYNVIQIKAKPNTKKSKSTLSIMPIWKL